MKKVILTILDGIGENKDSYGNSYLNSVHPALDFIYDNYYKKVFLSLLVNT